MASSLASAVLRRHTPPTWSYMSPGQEVAFVDVEEYTDEYEVVVDKIHRTLPKTIDSVIRIQNPYLWGCYVLKREEYQVGCFPEVEERELFHATAEDKIVSIAKNNLNWRLTKRTRYGHGVSFSPRADYCNQYCNQKVGHRRAIILAKVLVSLETRGQYGTKIPPYPFDTTTGKSGKVVVKYYDNDFYPEYVAYYTD